MKAIKFISAIIFLTISVFFFSNCDIIDHDYKDKTNNNPIDTSKTIKKILLEDFTGFKCGNCPKAQDIAKDLAENIYTGKIIVVSVHAGGYADTDKVHTYNFKTICGDEIDEFFGVSKIGNPFGLLNRKEINGNRIIAPTQWSTAISQMLDEQPIMKIKLTPSYNESSKEITVDTDIEYLEAGNSNHKLAVYILEDSIVQYQKDYRIVPPASQDIWDYVHNHVLRGSITSTWGAQLSSGDIAIGAIFKKQYKFTIPADKDWRPEKLRIITYVYDGATYEVLQTEESSLISN